MSIAKFPTLILVTDISSFDNKVLTNLTTRVPFPHIYISSAPTSWWFLLCGEVSGGVKERWCCLSTSLSLSHSSSSVVVNQEIEAASLKSAGWSAPSADSLVLLGESADGCTATERSRDTESEDEWASYIHRNSGEKTKKHVPVFSGPLRFIPGLILQLMFDLLFFHLFIRCSFLLSSLLLSFVSLFFILLSYFLPPAFLPVLPLKLLFPSLFASWISS